MNTILVVIRLQTRCHSPPPETIILMEVKPSRKCWVFFGVLQLIAYKFNQICLFAAIIRQNIHLQRGFRLRFNNPKMIKEIFVFLTRPKKNLPLQIKILVDFNTPAHYEKSILLVDNTCYERRRHESRNCMASMHETLHLLHHSDVVSVASG